MNLREVFEKAVESPVTLMEVCGTHTVNIFRFGIRSLLPERLRLLSGPGCPVCVMPQEEVDALIELSFKERVVVAVFGDLLKVPGSKFSLKDARARGANVVMIYSPLDAVDLAEKNPHVRVVLSGVGFETTAPAHAVAVKEAKKRALKNFFFLSSLRLIPPALDALLSRKEVSIDGLILPGHVSAIIGARAYEFLAERFKIPGVITGFEPKDIVEGILMLVKLIGRRESRIEVQYRRVVGERGNEWGLKVMEEVFEVVDGRWRGFGKIPKSKLKLRGPYLEFSAEEAFGLELKPVEPPKGCRCGDVLRGVLEPPECPLFAKACTPESPKGPCMVSSEGSCAAYYHFRNELGGES